MERNDSSKKIIAESEVISSDSMNPDEANMEVVEDTLKIADSSQAVHTSETTQKNTRIEYMYEKQHFGQQFSVFFYKGEALADKAYSDIEISRIIFKAGFKDYEVNRISRRGWEIVFNNKKDANRMVNEPFFRNKGFNVYIPKHKVFQQGIVRLGRTDNFDEDELVMNINQQNTNMCATRARRLKRKVKDEQGKVTWVNTSSFCVEFKKYIYGMPEYKLRHT